MFTERKNGSTTPCPRRTRTAANYLLETGCFFTKATLGLGLLLAGSLAQAQSNDHLFRSWRWAEDIPAPRAAGMGGAFVAVADDSSSTFLNPAGLTLLPKTELSTGLLSRGPGAFPAVADALAANTRFGFVSGAGLLTEKWAIGAYVNEPRKVRSDLSPMILPDGSQDVGYIDATVRDVGAAVGWRPADRVRVGMRVNISHLRILGEYSEHEGTGDEDLRVGLAAGSSRVTGNLGVLIEPVDRVRVGLVIQSGASWAVERTAINPTLGVVLDSGTEFIVRAPAVVSGGASIRLSDRVLAAAQLDYVRYREIQSVLAVRRGGAVRDDYRLDNAFEPHAGLEFSWPVRSVSLQFRGGIQSQGPATLAYKGENPSEAAAFRGSERRLLTSAGASIVGRSGVRADVGATFGGDRRIISAGLAIRF